MDQKLASLGANIVRTKGISGDSIAEEVSPEEQIKDKSIK